MVKNPGELIIPRQKDKMQALHILLWFTLKSIFCRNPTINIP